MLELVPSESGNLGPSRAREACLAGMPMCEGAAAAGRNEGQRGNCHRSSRRDFSGPITVSS